jgi:archaellum component FlaC
MSRKEFFDSLSQNRSLSDVINRQVVPEMLLEMNAIKKINLDILPVITDDIEVVKKAIGDIKYELTLIKNDITTLKMAVGDIRDNRISPIEKLEQDISALQTQFKKILSKKLSIQLYEEGETG